MPHLRTTAPRYFVSNLLGEGLNSRVYKAIRTDSSSDLKLTVALKILKSKKLVDMWKQEFTTLRAVRSPHCVTVLGWEWIAARPALVLEYIEGVSLNDLLKRERLQGIEIEFILQQVRAGLLDLAAAGLCHGDLSPSNVLISSRGEVKLIDFGLANVMFRQATAEFAAPSVVAGERPSLQSDLYSLDCLHRFLLGFVDTEEPEDGLTLAASVAQKAQRVLAYKQLNQRTQFLEKPRAWGATLVRLAGVLVLPLFLLTGQASEIMAYRRPATLSVRTGNWARVFIDGRDFGFSPLVGVPLVPGLHDVRVVTATGQHSIPLTVRGGDNIVLKDQMIAASTTTPRK